MDPKDLQEGFLMPPHPLTNFEIQKYYQNEPILIGVYSRHNLPDKIKNGAYVTNLDEHSNIETYWSCMNWTKMWLTLIVLEVNTFQRKSETLSRIKTYKQLLLEYMHIIQQCVHIFVLYLLVLCLQVRL